MPLTKFSTDQFIKGVYSGRISVNNLPIDLYNETQEVLSKHLFDGFNGSLKDFTPGTPEYNLLSKLRTNIQLFSAAKTYQQVRAVDHEARNNPSYTDFKAKATATVEKFNGTWLQAEADTTLGQAQSARKWLDFEKTKAQFQLLQYDAILDPNTSDICRHLDGIVLPVDHPFWNTHAPLNHFGCRCLLRKLSKYEEIKQSSKSEVDKAAAEVAKEQQPLFKMNPGKEGMVFQETGPGKHSYFKVPNKDKKLALRNFNLPLSDTKKAE